MIISSGIPQCSLITPSYHVYAFSRLRFNAFACLYSLFDSTIIAGDKCFVNLSMKSCTFYYVGGLTMFLVEFALLTLYCIVCICSVEDFYLLPTPKCRLRCCKIYEMWNIEICRSLLLVDALFELRQRWKLLKTFNVSVDYYLLARF